MKLVYMKSTIDFIASKHSHRIPAIESIGTPDLVISNNSTYYKFNIDEKQDNK